MVRGGRPGCDARPRSWEQGCWRDGVGGEVVCHDSPEAASSSGFPHRPYLRSGSESRRALGPNRALCSPGLCDAVSRVPDHLAPRLGPRGNATECVPPPSRVHGCRTGYRVRIRRSWSSYAARTSLRNRGSRGRYSLTGRPLRGMASCDSQVGEPGARPTASSTSPCSEGGKCLERIRYAASATRTGLLFRSACTSRVNPPFTRRSRSSVTRRSPLWFRCSPSNPGISQTPSVRSQRKG